ncbi:DUF4365 domain-containing protein [Streptomyces lavendulae]|uniref:DUF4365 domain-containing protein n=1 Tax=Streptomyces lavendulae TaxID=1914 RepID=UPI0036F031B9
MVDWRTWAGESCNARTRFRIGGNVKRPIQHQIASCAVAAVRHQWNMQGHAVDEVKEDYGEDLLVQTCLDGKVDASRIWVQVKGTDRFRENPAASLPKIRVKAAQILRWSRSADLVVTVLWDVAHDRGWYVMPQGFFDPVELWSSKDRQVALTFQPDCIFHQQAVTELAWAARIEHANRGLQYARHNISESKEMGLQVDLEFHKGVWWTLLFDFAATIGIIRPDDGQVDEAFALLVMEMTWQHSVPDVLETARRATFMAIIEVFDRRCAGSGAPLALVKELAEVVHPRLFTDELLDVLRRNHHKTPGGRGPQER